MKNNIRLCKSFKKNIHDRIDELEARGNTDPLLEEKVDKANKEISFLQKSIDEIYKINQRPGSTGEFPVSEIRGFDHFLRTGDASQIESKSMDISTPSGGGYAVPEYLDIDLQTYLKDVIAMRRLATIKKAETEKYTKVVSRSGFVGGYVGETDSRGETGTPTIHTIEAPAAEMYANPKLSQRFIDDAGFDVASWISAEIKETFAQLEGAAFISGTGSDEPKGILAYTSTTDPDSTRAFGVLKHSVTAAPTVITADELQQIVYDLRAPYRAGASWLMNSSTAGTIMALKDTTGRYLWSESLSAGQPPRLFGYPVAIDENMPDMAAGEVPVFFW